MERRRDMEFLAVERMLLEKLTENLIRIGRQERGLQKKIKIHAKILYNISVVQVYCMII